jgi:hypothetical protein
MKAERAKLARLQRLERIRDIARRNALVEAGLAEGTLPSCRGWPNAPRACRSTMPRDAQDAAALQHLHQFVRGLDEVTNGTRADMERARAIADAKAREAAEAERRRAAVEDRVEAQSQLIARKTAASTVALTAKKAFGTNLE